MNEFDTTPVQAYDLLSPTEKVAVDTYVRYAIGEQKRLGERIIHAVHKVIPAEYIRRSQNALYKPLVRAAISEQLRAAAHQQDISPARVIQEHAAIAFSDIGDYLEPAEFGLLSVKNLDKIPAEKRAAIKSIQTKPGPFGMETKLVLHDKHPSLKAMGEMTGLVAPDRPAALEGYVKPPEATKQLDVAPEKAYTDLLEQVVAR